MKFTISRLHLSAALNSVSRAVSSKNPKPILTGIKFELNQNGLFLTGTDSDISIITKIPLEQGGEVLINSIKQGVVVLSSKYITEIVRKLESDKLEFDLVSDNVLKVKDSNSEFSLNCMDATDYPGVELIKGEATIKLPSSVFRMIVNQTSFAASDKETRPILTGVNFRTEGDNLEVVATDSYRLAKKVIKMPGVKPFNVTIPAKTLNEISRIIENEKEVDINISDKKVVFTLPKTLVVTRVISGSYPDTNKLIPESFDYELDTISQSFISAIDRASLLSIDRQNVVKLSLSANKIQVTSKSQEIGSASENVVSYRYNGSPLDVSFTSSYVIDAIRALGTEEVTILFNGEMKPFIIRSKGDNSTIQLVLPVRTY